MEPSRPLKVFVAYRDSRERRSALAQAPGALERYRLFGLDELVQRGVGVRHNLERAGAPLSARVVDRGLNRVLYGAGGYGGDFVSVLPSLRSMNAADVVFSTVDTVGIPLMFLRRAKLLRKPLVYTAIGLPERLLRLRGGGMRGLYANALRACHTIVTYAESEAEWLRDWIGPDAPPIRFVPFGVDVNAFQPVSDLRPTVDIISVGADPRRDFELLKRIASHRPELSFRIVASTEHARSLGSLPANVAIETDMPLDAVRDRIAGARVVALPVRDNSYSGATTMLLQAMAMAKPVVVSRTRGIAKGYGLEDGVNCRLVEPADGVSFERALTDLVADAGAAANLGTRARETVVRSFSWERYTDALWEILSGANRPPSGRSQGSP